MIEDRNLNRRKVLRNAAAAGTASLLGMTASVGATPEEASIDIDQLLESDRIEKLKKEIPDLKFRSEDARVLGGKKVLSLFLQITGRLLLAHKERQTPQVSISTNGFAVWTLTGLKELKHG
ncbi:hypothetical protein [Natrinema pellirubrum]|nr:hypothetical protein [Natrinema pellirubrum]